MKNYSVIDGGRFACLIKRLRKENYKTVRDFTKIKGLSQISQWENEYSLPSLRSLGLFLDEINMSYSEFFSLLENK